MDGNITPEKARLQIDLLIATNGVSRQNRVVWSLCLVTSSLPVIEEEMLSVMFLLS